MSEADRLLVDSTAQGLVRFDANGQVEPGLAERWIVIDQGTSYIFRLREARWSDGTPVTAAQVAAALRRRIARGPLRPFLSAVDQVVAMTPQVLEVRLSRQRPDLLKLFAQPELGIVRIGKPAGTGPFRVVSGRPYPLLRPVEDPARADPDRPREAEPEEDVRLIAERPARGVARFAGGESDLLSGGDFASWPLLAAVDVRPAEVRVDPAAGLFGLAVVNRSGFLADAMNRAAISQALDRTTITAAVAPAWEQADRLLPEALDSARPPTVPAWSILTLDQRRAGARARVAGWAGGPVTLRVALPDGPGATRLWGGVAASLIAIGVQPRRVPLRAPAELRLVDRVAPYDSGRWYLATACQPCGPEARAAVDAARDAPTMAARAEAIARADAALDADVPFIPLARPYRWSLVSRRLRAWQPNARAWHVLNHLRPDPNSGR